MSQPMTTCAGCGAMRFVHGRCGNCAPVDEARLSERRAVLLRVAEEVEATLDAAGAWVRTDMRNLAAKYRREAEEK